MVEEPALEQGAEEQPVPKEEQEQPGEPLSIEALAVELGWKPQDQWKGDPATWTPADQYLRSGRESKTGLIKEVRGLRDQVDRISRTSAQILEDQLAAKTAERDAYWQGIHAKAVEEGDTVTANKAVGEIVKLQAAPAPGAAAQPGEPPETAEFRQRHAAWLGKDPLATARAYEVADQMRRMNYDIPTQLREAERAVRKEFPELFPQAKPPAATQTGGARNANGSGRKKGFADMPLESQNMAKDYLKRHGIPLEKTAESYWADASNHERKVG